MVVLEALLHGTPVAVFEDVGGARSLVEHTQNGFILQEVNDMRKPWQELAESPGKLYEQHTNIQKMDLSDYNPANIRKKLEDLILQ